MVTRQKTVVLLLVLSLAACATGPTPAPDDEILTAAVTGVVQWARDRQVQYQDPNFQIMEQGADSATVQATITAPSADNPAVLEEQVAWLRVTRGEKGWTINPNTVTFSSPDILAQTLRPDLRERFWYNRGIVAQQAQEWTKAVDALARAVALQPDYEDAAERLNQIRGQLAATADVLFVTNRTGSFHVWAMPRSGENPFVLNVDGSGDWLGRWSPDGRQIVFSEQLANNNWQLFVASESGADRRQITNIPAKNVDAAWSPDGASILFSSDIAGSPDLYLLAVPPIGQTAAITDAVRLTSDPGGETEASYSPDGRWILYTFESNGNRDLYLMPAPGPDGPAAAQPVALTAGDADEWEGAWSPDGTGILYTTDANQRWDVYWLPAPVDGRPAAGEPVNVTATPNANDWHAVWAPDSASFAFVTDRDANAEIYVQAAPGKGGPDTAANISKSPAEDWPSDWRALP